MEFVQVCPEIPDNGVCPVPLEWVVLHARPGISAGEFVDMLPWMLGLTVFCWGMNLLARRIHYTR